MSEFEEKIEKAQKRSNEFEAVARPLIKWMCENCHPHVTAIITPTSCELLEGLCMFPDIDDYLVD